MQFELTELSQPNSLILRLNHCFVQLWQRQWYMVPVAEITQIQSVWSMVCSKRYPKEFLENTRFGENGYPQYAHPNNGRVFVNHAGYTYTNCDVIPHNPYLSAKYDCYIKVEVCATSEIHLQVHFQGSRHGYSRNWPGWRWNTEWGWAISQCKVYWTSWGLLEALWVCNASRTSICIPSSHLEDEQQVIWCEGAKCGGTGKSCWE